LIVAVVFVIALIFIIMIVAVGGDCRADRDPEEAGADRERGIAAIIAVPVISGVAISIIAVSAVSKPIKGIAAVAMMTAAAVAISAPVAAMTAVADIVPATPGPSAAIAAVAVAAGTAIASSASGVGFGRHRGEQGAADHQCDRSFREKRSHRSLPRRELEIPELRNSP
jgi:hypothetical protein